MSKTKKIRDPLKCGECGGDTFKLQHVKSAGEVRFGGEGAGGITGYIRVVCLKCNNVSSIKPAPARLIRSEGYLCGGWR